MRVRYIAPVVVFATTAVAAYAPVSQAAYCSADMSSSVLEALEAQGLGGMYRIKKTALGSGRSQFELTVNEAGILQSQTYGTFPSTAADYYVECEGDDFGTKEGCNTGDTVPSSMAMAMVDMAPLGTYKQKVNSGALQIDMLIDYDNSVGSSTYYSDVLGQCQAWGAAADWGATYPEWMTTNPSGYEEFIACIDPNWMVDPGLFWIDFSSSSLAGRFGSVLDAATLYTSNLCTLSPGSCPSSLTGGVQVKVPSTVVFSYDSAIVNTTSSCGWDEEANEWVDWEKTPSEVCTELTAGIIDAYNSSFDANMFEPTGSSKADEMEQQLTDYLAAVVMGEGAAGLAYNRTAKAYKSNMTVKSVSTVNDGAESCAGHGLKGGLRFVFEADDCGLNNAPQVRVDTPSATLAYVEPTSSKTFKIWGTDPDQNMTEVSWSVTTPSTTLSKTSAVSGGCMESSYALAMTQVGTYTISATVKDAAGNNTVQTWNIRVMDVDTETPTPDDEEIPLECTKPTPPEWCYTY